MLISIPKKRNVKIIIRGTNSIYGNTLIGTNLYIEIELLPIIIIMSVFGFGGVLFLFLEGLKRIGTVKTMSMFSLTPMFGIIVAATIPKEPISVFQAIATGIIILGIFIISRR